MDNNIILVVIGLVILLLVGTIIHLALKLRASQSSVRYSEDHSQELGDELFSNNDVASTASQDTNHALAGMKSDAQGTENNTQSNKVIGQVAEFLAEGHDTKALALLNAAVTQHPENSKYHMMLLNIYAKNNDANNFEKTVDSLHALGNVEAIAKANKLREQLKPSANELPVADLLAKNQPAAAAPASIGTDGSSAESNLFKSTSPVPTNNQTMTAATASSMSAIDAALNNDVSISQQLSAIEHTLVSSKPLATDAPAQSAEPNSKNDGDIDDILFSFDEEVETYKSDDTLAIPTNELDMPVTTSAGKIATTPSNEDGLFSLELENNNQTATEQVDAPTDTSSNGIDFSFDDFADKATTDSGNANNDVLAFDMPTATPAATIPPAASLEEPVNNDIAFDFSANSDIATSTSDDNAGFEFEVESPVNNDIELDISSNTDTLNTELSLDTNLSPTSEIETNKNVTLEMLAAEAGVSIDPPKADLTTSTAAPTDTPMTESANITTNVTNDTFAEFDALFAESKKNAPPVAPPSESGSGIFTGIATTAAVGAAALAATASENKVDLSVPDMPTSSDDISLNLSQVDIDVVSSEQVANTPATTGLSFENPASETPESTVTDVADVTFAAEFDQINPNDLNTGSFDTLDLAEQDSAAQTSTTDDVNFDFTPSTTPNKEDDFEFSLGDAVTSAHVTTVSAAALTESSSADNDAFLSKLQSELNFIVESDANETNLELASSYIKLGEFSSAKSLLQEVMQTGNETQKNQANKLITNLAA